MLKEKVKIASCKEHLDPIPRAEAYSGPCQTSIIQIFALTNFEKKLHHGCLTGSS